MGYPQIRKIEKMYYVFGRDFDHQCKTCQHFVRYRQGNHYFSKCKVYGETSSEASDWRASNIACGCYNKDYHGDAIMARRRIYKNTPIEGQIEGQTEIEL